MENDRTPTVQWRSPNPPPVQVEALQTRTDGRSEQARISIADGCLVSNGRRCRLFSGADSSREDRTLRSQTGRILLPGKPLHFATAMPFAGYGIGLVVTSDQGRPIKIEGNTNHPASLGATDVFIEASLLSLYDPERAKSITYLGAIAILSARLCRASLTALVSSTAMEALGCAYYPGRLPPPQKAR